MRKLRRGGPVKWLTSDLTFETKPPYRIPSMAEIAAIPWNGLTVVSTFSGCGGSCLGFRLAGFRVLWANEFIPAAQATYRLNHPETALDPRDIREVRPEEIRARIGLARGQLDVLDGSPPCAAYSISGKREEVWGKVRKYSDTSQRVDDLFGEYARILAGLHPRAFVVENVPGLLLGAARAVYDDVLARLRAAGYRVSAKILDAQFYGVPQVRRRLFFLGFREDLGMTPTFPSGLSYRYSTREALPWLDGGGPHPPRIPTDADPHSLAGYAIAAEWAQLAPGGKSDHYKHLARLRTDAPGQTVTARGGEHGGAAGLTHPYEARKLTVPELRRLFGYPDDFVVTGTFDQQWERFGRSVPPPLMAAIARTLRDRLRGPGKDDDA